MANRRLAHQSLQVYLSGLSFYSRMFRAPLKITEMHNLYHTSRAIRRSRGNSLTRIKGLPISIRQILTYIRVVYPNKDGKMLWCAVTMAYFGLLRSAEYTSPTHNQFSHSTLLLNDITLCINRVFINVKISKTDPFRQGAIVRLFRLNSLLCPVSATSTYLHTLTSHQGPLFQFQNGSFLTRNWMAGFLKSVFPFTNNINTHSFRIGGATAASSQGIPDTIIQIMGRWTSDCFKKYIRVSDQELCDYQRRMTIEAKDITIWDSDTLSSHN